MVSSEGACAAYWSYGRFREETAGGKKVARVKAGEVA
jgi:hypothetical protein